MGYSPLTFGVLLLLLGASTTAYKPNYSYHASVADPGAGNFHEKQETRYLDNTSGYYSVLEPDGRLREVSYVSDAGGFRPTITYSYGHAPPPPPAVKVVQPVKVAYPQGGYAVAHHQPVKVLHGGGGYHSYSGTGNSYASAYGSPGFSYQEMRKFHKVAIPAVAVSQPLVHQYHQVQVPQYHYVQPAKVHTKLVQQVTPFIVNRPQVTVVKQQEPQGGYSYSKPSAPLVLPSREYLPAEEPSREYLPAEEPTTTTTTTTTTPKPVEFESPQGGYSYEKPKIPFEEGHPPRGTYLPPQETQKVILPPPREPLKVIQQVSAPAPIPIPQKFIIARPPNVQLIQQVAHIPQPPQVVHQFQPQIHQVQQIHQIQPAPQPLKVISGQKVVHPLVFSYGYDQGNSKVHHSYSGSGW